jgi:hypothetical protein
MSHGNGKLVFESYAIRPHLNNDNIVTYVANHAGPPRTMLRSMVACLVGILAIVLWFTSVIMLLMLPFNSSVTVYVCSSDGILAALIPSGNGILSVVILLLITTCCVTCLRPPLTQKVRLDLKQNVSSFGSVGHLTTLKTALIVSPSSGSLSSPPVEPRQSQQNMLSHIHPLAPSGVYAEPVVVEASTSVCVAMPPPLYPATDFPDADALSVEVPPSPSCPPPPLPVMPSPSLYPTLQCSDYVADKDSYLALH